MLKWLITLTLLATHLTPSAAPITFQSSVQKVNLLELYTSEGCSSCPPADRWISQLKTDPRLWHEVVPVAFHVDYWDQLGWLDIYAKHDYSLRQYVHRQQGHVSSVYTPGVMVNGQELIICMTNIQTKAKAICMTDLQCIVI